MILPEQVQLNHLIALDPQTGKQIATGMVLGAVLVITIIIVQFKLKG